MHVTHIILNRINIKVNFNKENITAQYIHQSLPLQMVVQTEIINSFQPDKGFQPSSLHSRAFEM